MLTNLFCCCCQDPYYTDNEKDFETCFQLLEQSVTSFVKTLMTEAVEEGELEEEEEEEKEKEAPQPVVEEPFVEAVHQPLGGGEEQFPAEPPPLLPGPEVVPEVEPPKQDAIEQKGQEQKPYKRQTDLFQQVKELRRGKRNIFFT